MFQKITEDGTFLRRRKMEQADMQAVAGNETDLTPPLFETHGTEIDQPTLPKITRPDQPAPSYLTQTLQTSPDLS